MVSETGRSTGNVETDVPGGYGEGGWSGVWYEVVVKGCRAPPLQTEVPSRVVRKSTNVSAGHGGQSAMAGPFDVAKDHTFQLCFNGRPVRFAGKLERAADGSLFLLSVVGDHFVFIRPEQNAGLRTTKVSRDV